MIAKQNIVHQGDTQGTTYVIKYHGADSVDQRVIDEVLEQVDVEFNLWRPDSRINAVNAFKSHQTVFSFEDSNRLWSVLWDKCLEMHACFKRSFRPDGSSFGGIVGVWIEKQDLGCSRGC